MLLLALCHSLLEELKSKYAQESSRAAAALDEVNTEKERLITQLAGTNAEISKLHETVKNLEKTNLRVISF